MICWLYMLGSKTTPSWNLRTLSSVYVALVSSGARLTSQRLIQLWSTGDLYHTLTLSSSQTVPVDRAPHCLDFQTGGGGSTTHYTTSSLILLHSNSSMQQHHHSYHAEPHPSKTPEGSHWNLLKKYDKFCTKGVNSKWLPSIQSLQLQDAELNSTLLQLGATVEGGGVGGETSDLSAAGLALSLPPPFLSSSLTRIYKHSVKPKHRVPASMHTCQSRQKLLRE